MDPTMTLCPNLACPARGHTGQGNIGIHARQNRHFICTQCRQTFAATYGTVLYRLRTAGDLVTRILTLRAHGCPVPAMVVAFGGRRANGGGRAGAVPWGGDAGADAQAEHSRAAATRDVSPGTRSSNSCTVPPAPSHGLRVPEYSPGLHAGYDLRVRWKKASVLS